MNTLMNMEYHKKFPTILHHIDKMFDLVDHENICDIFHCYIEYQNNDEDHQQYEKWEFVNKYDEQVKKRNLMT